MAAVEATGTGQGTLVGAEKAKLRKVLGRFDLVIISEAFVVVTAVTLLWPGAINNLFGQSYSIESVYSVSRPFFEWVTLGSVAAMIAIGLVFWVLGERKLRAGLTGITISVEPGD